MVKDMPSSLYNLGLRGKKQGQIGTQKENGGYVPADRGMAACSFGKVYVLLSGTVSAFSLLPEDMNLI